MTLSNPVLLSVGMFKSMVKPADQSIGWINRQFVFGIGELEFTMRGTLINIVFIYIAKMVANDQNVKEAKSEKKRYHRPLVETYI